MGALEVRELLPYQHLLSEVFSDECFQEKYHDLTLDAAEKALIHEVAQEAIAGLNLGPFDFSNLQLPYIPIQPIQLPPLPPPIPYHQPIYYSSSSRNNEPNPVTAIIELGIFTKRHEIAYGVMQLALAILQVTSLNWARTAFRIQQVMLFTDTLLIISKMWEILLSTEGNKQKAFALLSFLIYSYALKKWMFHDSQASYGPLPSHLSTLLPKEGIDLMKMQTLAPSSFRAVKGFIGTKLVLDAIHELLYESKDKRKKVFVISALALLILAQVRWISIKRTIQNPLKNVTFNGGKKSNAFADGIHQVTLEMEMILPYKGRKVFSAPEFMKKVYDYTTEFFQESWWDCTGRGLLGGAVKEVEVSAKVLTQPMVFEGNDFFATISWKGTILGRLPFQGWMKGWSNWWSGEAPLLISFKNAQAS